MSQSASIPVATASAAAREQGLYYRHRLPVRIMHWINVVALTLLFMSGLQIFNSHPALYWGKSSYTGKPPLLQIGTREDSAGRLVGVTNILGHEFTTTGVLGVSTDEGRTYRQGFPDWLTVPSHQWLSMARTWHFFFAWIFVINGLCYIAYSVVSRHLANDLWPTRAELRGIGASIVEHLHFRHPGGEAAKRYNVLQKLAYVIVIFVLLPLIVLMGMAMSPRLDTLLTGWVDWFGGRQSARTIHFLVAWALVAFVLIHVFQVIVTGLWNNLRSMITGRYRVPPEAA
ncbi:MAG TPA: cytochrome b/b6 domain-containing protein [Casimicrobiaceae bacterium]|nr:cytochrome b/b6 domain-containing protein [Casimicrobiaceae bacterium]